MRGGRCDWSGRADVSASSVLPSRRAHGCAVVSRRRTRYWASDCGPDPGPYAPSWRNGSERARWGPHRFQSNNGIVRRGSELACGERPGEAVGAARHEVAGVGVGPARRGAEAAVGDVEVDVGRTRCGASSWAWPRRGRTRRPSGRAPRTPAGDRRAMRSPTSGERQLDPLGVEVQPVLLGHDERERLLGDGRGPTSEAGGGTAIGVAVARAEPEPLDAARTPPASANVTPTRGRSRIDRSIMIALVERAPRRSPRPTVGGARSARPVPVRLRTVRIHAAPRRRTSTSSTARRSRPSRRQPPAGVARRHVARRIVVVGGRPPQRQLRPPDHDVAERQPVVADALDRHLVASAPTAAPASPRSSPGRSMHDVAATHSAGAHAGRAPRRGASANGQRVAPGRRRRSGTGLATTSTAPWADRRQRERPRATTTPSHGVLPAGLEVVEAAEPTAVLDAQLAGRPTAAAGTATAAHDAPVRSSAASSPQQRVGHPIGRHQAVAHEAAVVERFAEVAAVGEPRRAVGVGAPQPVVGPLPHEPALQSGLGAEHRPVVGQAAGLTHRVVVLAQDQRATSRRAARATTARSVRPTRTSDRRCPTPGSARRGRG